MTADSWRMMGWIVVGACAVVGGNSSAASAQCSVPTGVDAELNSVGYFDVAQETRPFWQDSGDLDFRGTTRACHPDWVDDLQDHYDIRSGEWQNGKGFPNPCHVSLLYGRFLTGLYVLNWATPDPPETWGDLSGNALRRAGNYAAEFLIDIEGRCRYEGATVALTQAATTWWWPVDEWSRYFKGFAYQMTPVHRAATIYHEARHAHGYPHDGNDGGNACHAEDDGCDERYEDVFSIARANSYEVHFLLDYVTFGINRDFGGSTSSAPHLQRRSAQRVGNWQLDEWFDDRTSTAWRISGLTTHDGWCPLDGGEFGNPCPVVLL